jgi:O-antigen/teichoic acid export membrane protein
MTAVTAKAKRSEVPGSRGGAQAVMRLGWGVADQGISSLSNFALGIFVARSFSASHFGAFALAFVTYTVVINAARGLATDPLLVRYSGDVNHRWRLATSSASGTALAVGLVVGALCVVAGLLLPDPLGPVYLALGVGLPGLVLQDSWRFAFFASGRGASAFANDLFWSVLLVLALIVMHYRGDGSAVRCLLAFGATATLAAVLGSIQARVLPRPLRALLWLRAHRNLSVRYFLENVSISGAALLRSFVLGAVASLAAVGYVRASEILMGPILVLLAGLSQVAVPEASRVFYRDSTHLRRFCLILGSAQASAAATWGLILMVVFPLWPGPALLQELWTPTAQLLLPITFTVVGISFATAAAAGLRAMGVSRRSLRAQLTGSAAYVIGASIGAVLDGAVGASWGVAAAMFLSTLVWWYHLRAALADHHSAVLVGNENVSGAPQIKSEGASSPRPDIRAGDGMRQTSTGEPKRGRGREQVRGAAGSSSRPGRHDHCRQRIRQFGRAGQVHRWRD